MATRSKPPAKKAAKKAAAPKQKLKEGKYSHKFLVRLQPVHGELFEELLKDSNKKTYNGLVVFMISTYARIAIDLQNTKSQLHKAQDESRRLGLAIQKFASSFNELLHLDDDKRAAKGVDMNLGPAADECPECGERLDEDGDCTNDDCFYTHNSGDDD